MKKIFTNPIFTFILGIVLCGGGVFAANTFSPDTIPYTSNGQSTVEGALNDLYTRANTWINPSNMTNSKSITSNGTYDITNYKNASVNVPNTNSATYTPTSNGTALDMGATNTYRYVNTSTVYNSGINLVVDSIKSELTKIVSTSTNNVYRNIVFVTNQGLCIIKSGKMNCFKARNYNTEKTHIQTVFGTSNCSVTSSKVSCSDDEYDCYVDSSGKIDCGSYGLGCSVDSNNAIMCYEDLSPDWLPSPAELSPVFD